MKSALTLLNVCWLLGAQALADSFSARPWTLKLSSGASRELAVSIHSPKPFADASGLEETQHVAPLTRSSGSRSSRYTYSLRTGKPLDQAPIYGIGGGSEFLLPIEFGGQSFLTIMDTGSSNIWVARKGFTCVESPHGKEIPESRCGFGPLYHTTERFKPIRGLNFNSTYASSEALVGVPGYETVSLAGVTVPKQEFGAIDYAYWFGDGKSSSLLGLAYPVVTSVFKGKNDSKDQSYERINYSPLFTTMYTKGLVKPVFSVELGRNGEDGRLALGGIPSGYKHAQFASAPIQIVNLTHFGSATEYSFYTVIVDGFIVQDASSKKSKNTDWIPASFSNSNQRDVIKANYSAIVDSGTTLNYVTDRVAKQIISAFDPKGYHQDGTFFVDCKAVKPSIAVVIGGRAFHVQPEQLSYRSGGECISGFQGGIREDKALHVLGDSFLQSVLAVFDVGASEMRFAQR